MNQKRQPTCWIIVGIDGRREREKPKPKNLNQETRPQEIDSHERRTHDK